MATLANTIEMEVRHGLAQPYRLASQRRALRKSGQLQSSNAGAAVPESLSNPDATSTVAPAFGPSPAAQSGGTKAFRSERSERSTARGTRAPSLDTDKHLATSVRDWLKATETPADKRRDKLHFHSQLLGSVKSLVEEHAHLGNRREWIAWSKEFKRLWNCQKEWIGYRAECCKGATKPVAVPIGCNHRLCPLCAWHRAENARKRVRQLFGRLTHPALITLTIPNQPHIAKADYKLFRERVKSFISAQTNIRGGVYSLETTYNRHEKSWHVHVHILADLSAKLPAKGDYLEHDGTRIRAFRLLKLRMEFDWTRLWVTNLGKRPRKDASPVRRRKEESTFAKWFAQVEQNRTWARIGGQWQKNPMLEPVEMRAREEWNRVNRRVIDIKPVTDAEGAAYEVLKYITKVADFADLPKAIEEFLPAVRGARLIQTFGTWYGVKLEASANETDWSEMKCACGCNDWKRMGVFFMQDVCMDEQGRWHLRDGLDWRSRGRPKPTISALADPDPDCSPVIQIGNYLKEKNSNGSGDYELR